MLKKLRQLFCRHRRTVHVKSELIKVEGNEFRTRHIWQCKKCGKIIVCK